MTREKDRLLAVKEGRAAWQRWLDWNTELESTVNAAEP